MSSYNLVREIWLSLSYLLFRDELRQKSPLVQDCGLAETQFRPSELEHLTFHGLSSLPVNAFVTKAFVTLGFSSGSVVNNLPAIEDTLVWSLGQEPPLEKETGTHSTILAWEIPWSLRLRGSQKSQTWISN